MSLLPISQAAKIVGKHPTTLKAAIKKGKLSASKDSNGEWQIDMAEVTRIYPVKNKQEPENSILTNSHESSSALREENIILRQKNAVFEEKVIGFEKEISLLQKQLQQSEFREEDLRNLLSQNTKLLTYYTAKEDEQEKPKRKGWFFK